MGGIYGSAYNDIAIPEKDKSKMPLEMQFEMPGDKLADREW